MVDVTIGSNDYQGFTSVEKADEHLAADISRADAWAELDEDRKGRGIISATRVMLGLPWIEEAPDPAEDQASPIPEVCAELAADLIAKPKLMADASGNSNIKSVKAGSATVDFFSPVAGGPPIPRALWDRLVAAGLVGLESSSGTAVGAPETFGGGECRPLSGRYPWDWPIAEQDYC